MIRHDPNETKVCIGCGATMFYRDHMHTWNGRKFCTEPCYRLTYFGPKATERLYWGKVEKSDGCWLYKGRIDALGYGRYQSRGALAFAHRCAWIFTNGPIPSDRDVCHTCDVRNCCNPSHLFLGTHQENMDDMWAKDRHRGHLNADQVREIRRRLVNWKRGMNVALAREFGVSPQVICGIRVKNKYRKVSGSLFDIEGDGK